MTKTGDCDGGSGMELNSRLGRWQLSSMYADRAHGPDIVSLYMYMKSFHFLINEVMPDAPVESHRTAPRCSTDYASSSNDIHNTEPACGKVAMCRTHGASQVDTLTGSLRLTQRPK